MALGHRGQRQQKEETDTDLAVELDRMEETQRVLIQPCFAQDLEAAAEDLV